MKFLRIGNVIEDKHAIDLIACLYMRGEMPRTHLSRNVSTNPRMGQKIDRLIGLGLIQARKNGRRTDLRLSEKGEELARGLCMIEECMYGDVGDDECFNHGWTDPAECKDTTRKDVKTPRAAFR